MCWRHDRGAISRSELGRAAHDPRGVHVAAAQDGLGTRTIHGDDTREQRLLVWARTRDDQHVRERRMSLYHLWRKVCLQRLEALVAAHDRRVDTQSRHCRRCAQCRQKARRVGFSNKGRKMTVQRCCTLALVPHAVLLMAALLLF